MLRDETVTDRIDLVSVCRVLAALSQATIWLLVAVTVTWLQRRGGSLETTSSREELLASP